MSGGLLWNRLRARFFRLWRTLFFLFCHVSLTSLMLTWLSYRCPRRERRARSRLCRSRTCGHPCAASLVRWTGRTYTHSLRHACSPSLSPIRSIFKLCGRPTGAIPLIVLFHGLAECATGALVIFKTRCTRRSCATHRSGAKHARELIELRR